MIENLPGYVNVIFILTTVLTLWLLYHCVRSSDMEGSGSRSAKVLIFSIVWLIIQAVISINNFYNTDTKSFPPKLFLMGIFPAMLTVLLTFITAGGRNFTDSLSLKNLTYISIVRIPVEIVLYLLCQYKTVPEIMTFAGFNFDILAGLSSPFIAYFGLAKIKLSRKSLLLWNIISLGLLINIVVLAALSAPFSMQKFAFGQPNIAVLNFPFSWLPVFIVPVVLFSHIASIRQLLRTKD